MGEGRRGTGIGMASILLIILVLAFTTFGVLSLVSARTDVRMSRKAASTAAAYYEAEGKLQEQLVKLDADLVSGSLEVPADKQYILTSDVQGTQQLQLLVEVCQGTGSDGERFRILSQQLSNIADWNPDLPIDMWDGGM